MPQSNSLLSRLILRISLVVALSIALLSMLIYAQIDRTLETLRDQTVEQQARTIAERLEPGGDNRVFLNLPKALRQFYARAGNTYQYLVRDEFGSRIFTSPISFGGAFPRPNAKTDEAAFDFTGPNGRRFSGYTMKTEVGGHTVYVQVAQTLAGADIFSDDITDVFLSRLIWIGIPFYALLLLVITWTLRRGLRPLQKAADEVSRIDATRLDVRIGEEDVPAEVVPLVRSINYSFARLEQSIAEQQEMTENIAHELRTPLTILKTRIDTLARTEQTVKLSHDVDSLIRLVNQMLDMTRLEYADTLTKKSVDLAEVLSQACQDFFPLFIRAGRELRVAGVERPVMVRGDKDLIYRAICNLLDNALAHSPAKTPVDATLEGVTVRITDYGEKIPAARRSAIFERFQRGGTQTARKAGMGVGIGLSIVTKTMEAHGGHADLISSASGGNTFRMVFPRAS